MQEMPFKGRSNSETSWGMCPCTSQKTYASRSALTPLGKFVAMCPCPTQTNVLATPVF